MYNNYYTEVVKLNLKSDKGKFLLGTILLFSCLLFTQITPVSALETYHINKEWLNNSGFDNSSLWEIDIYGDSGDVNASIAGGEATFTVIGDEGGYILNANPPIAENWTESQNPEFIIPDISGIDETGCYIGHEYLEDPVPNYFGVTGNQTRNFPSMNWVHTVELPVNMSDYVITSASVSAVVNGSGDTNLETPGDTLLSGGYMGVGDYARFSINVADPNDIENYRIAYNKTTTLGKDISGPVGPNTYGQRVYLNDTNLVPVDEDLLILYLTKVLQYDYTNFSIILGIDAYCEDNYPSYDRDTFYDLRIKEFSLNFTYEKRIDQFTTVSYSQTGEIVNATTITNASMSFDYKIDAPWPKASPNSEIHTIINGKLYSETVKLDTFTSDYQTVEFSGIGLKNLLTPNLSITVLFQLYIADEFEFNDSVIISIDNVHFKVSYMIFTPDLIPNPGPNYLWLTVGLAAGLAVVSIVFTAYQTIFKFPVYVRKIRSVRRKIRRGLKARSSNVQSRAEQISKMNKFSLDLDNLEVKSPPKHL
jgi:hypothetical protein